MEEKNGALQRQNRGLQSHQRENTAHHIFMTPSIAEGSIRLGILKGLMTIVPSIASSSIAEGSIRLGILKAANGELAVSIKRRT